MEALPKFIIVWKDLTENQIYRTRTESRSKLAVKMSYDNEKYGSKLLFLFRIKSTKNGSMPLL
jgi:hypothetical protein